MLGLRLHVLTGTGRTLGTLRISEYQRVSVLQKKKKKKRLFIEVFLATEGVEILQILQKSEDVLYWSGDDL